MAKPGQVLSSLYHKNDLSVNVSKIETRIIRIEGTYADNLTTTFYLL